MKKVIKFMQVVVVTLMIASSILSTGEGSGDDRKVIAQSESYINEMNIERI